MTFRAYVSVNSKPDHPSGSEFPTPWAKKSSKPPPPGPIKTSQNPTPGGIFLNDSLQNHKKNETEVI